MEVSRISRIETHNTTTPLQAYYPGSRMSKPFFTNSPPVPYVHNFGGVYPGKQVQIRGIPHANASRFTIYIQLGGDKEPNEIAMCFDVRFSFLADKQVVVRNHKQGSWGREERDIPLFPFDPKVPFEITILFTGTCFRVEVNNTSLLEFDYRFHPMQHINTLRVDGDVQLSQVVIQ